MLYCATKTGTPCAGPMVVFIQMEGSNCQTKLRRLRSIENGTRGTFGTSMISGPMLCSLGQFANCPTPARSVRLQSTLCFKGVKYEQPTKNPTTTTELLSIVSTAYPYGGDRALGYYLCGHIRWHHLRGNHSGRY